MEGRYTNQQNYEYMDTFEEKNSTKAWTGSSKLENSMSFVTVISSSIELKLDDLCFRETRMR